MRLDKFLQENFELRSRTYAENLIKKGQVQVDGFVVVKPAFEVGEKCKVVILSDDDYASQGAHKLAKAFEDFDLTAQGKTCADIGCSNGGFTDFLIRNGAKNVLAIDVAECALPTALLESGKVSFLRANARELPNDIEEVDFVCGDVSFISLKHILPSVKRLLKVNGEAVMLIKPQFELGKSALSKKGIVLSEKDRQYAVEAVKGYVLASGLQILGTTTAPMIYDNKNIEYLIHLKN